MYSSSQIFRKFLFFRKPRNTSRFLRDNPQKKGQVVRVRINTPRKPNSARRKTLKLKFTNKLRPVAYVPGGLHGLKRFSTVLVRGRGPRDTPGVYLSAIRGVFDLQTPITCNKAPKTKRRSIYGSKRLDRMQKRVIIKRKKNKKIM